MDTIALSPLNQQPSASLLSTYKHTSDYLAWSEKVKDRNYPTLDEMTAKVNDDAPSPWGGGDTLQLDPFALWHPAKMTPTYRPCTQWNSY